MARARNIKPEFFKNRYLGKLSPYARLLFEGLWLLADREGRLEDEPEEIKLDTLPYDDVDVDELLNELTHPSDPKRQFIIRYEVGGERFIQIVNFKAHQNPHPKEKPSKIPPFEGFGKSHEISRQGHEKKFLVSEKPEQEMLNHESMNHESSSSSSVASEEEPKQRSGSCQFFKIKNRGEDLTEDEWLFRCYREQRMNQKQSLMGCDTLQSLLSLYPNHYEAHRRWLSQPIEVRMAAYAYTMLEVQPADPFRYALKAAENARSWNETFQKYLKITTKSVQQKDYLVKING